MDTEPAEPPDVPEDTGSVMSDIGTTVREAVELVATGGVDLGAIVLDIDEVWDSEESKIAQFVASGCSCNLGPHNSPCHRLFSSAQYREMRDECRELSKEEHDLVLMGELRAVTLRDNKTWRENDRQRTFSQFQFGGHRICQKTFCFLHSISRWKLNAIKASWLKNGLRPRQHTYTTPHNATNLSDIQHIVHFILQYAEDHAILLPGRIPGYKRDDIQLLPSSATKREVWELYCNAATQCAGSKVVCYSLFCRLWKQLTPQVVVAKPMADLCWTCQKNSTVIMRAQNRPIEEKTAVITYI